MNTLEAKLYPKVLVVSHNVFSTTNNMGKTMATFFKGWDKENIAQLYFHTEIPNSDICVKYFRITDFDMVEAILKFRKPGKSFDGNNSELNATGVMKGIYQLGKKKKPYLYLMRDLLWSTNSWKTKKLTNWVETFNPDVVFYAAGDYSFSMKIALQICISKNIPMIVFFGDDYYFLNTQKKSIINRFYRKIYKKNFLDMFSYLKCYITASDKMQRKYNEEFGKPGYAIMTSTVVNDLKKGSGQIKISYIGNLELGRWKQLLDIGRCLKSIGYVLNIYSAERNQKIISQLNMGNGINFLGPISADKVQKEINSSTLLIHVESMDASNREKTKYSMSTKIAESLGSGVCLFAYGPNDVSSMEYLIENNAACVVSNKNDLEEKLLEILSDKELREEYINNALNLAIKRHNFTTNTRMFQKIVTELFVTKEGNT